MLAFWEGSTGVAVHVTVERVGAVGVWPCFSVCSFQHPVCCEGFVVCAAPLGRGIVASRPLGESDLRVWDGCPLPPPRFLVDLFAFIGKLDPKVLNPGFGGEPATAMPMRKAVVGYPAPQAPWVDDDPSSVLLSLRPLGPYGGGPEVCRGLPGLCSWLLGR